MQVTEVPSNGDFEMTSVGLEDEVARGAGENGFGDVTAAERAERYPAGNSSAAGAIANFVNTIVGAGIVGLPFALAQVCARFMVPPVHQPVFGSPKLDRTLYHTSTASISAFSWCVFTTTGQPLADEPCSRETHIVS